MSLTIDKTSQLGEFDTITREEYRRINGAAPAAEPSCLECGEALTPVQIKRGGKFCSSRCGGTYNARIPAMPKPVNGAAALEETPVAIVHDLPGPVSADDDPTHPLAGILLELVGQALTAASEWQFAATIGDVTLTLHKEPA